MARAAAAASRLWTEELPGSRPAQPAPPSIRLRIRIRIDALPGPPGRDPEREAAWVVADDEVRMEADGIALVVRPASGEAEGRVAPGLLEERPDLFARLLLETPVTLAKMTRAQLLHAGALVGPGGAVVVRGAAGAGKSTLVAAGWRTGLGVLGDESLLVDRDDPDALEATLRDLAVTPDGARLLGLEEATVPAFSGGEEKRRVPLFASARPSDRTARRLATLLLGPRNPGPARLVSLGPDELAGLFEAGSIPQERSFGGDPAPVAAAWGPSRSFRLDGAVDLAGALRIVTDLTR